jgi:hypothetical protein
MLKLKWTIWAYGLGSGIIKGGASTVVSWIGMSAAKGAGVDVPSLDFKALGIMFGSGVIVGMFTFLTKFPLPEVGNKEELEQSSIDDEAKASK